jgi:glucose/galactose transporter
MNSNARGTLVPMLILGSFFFLFGFVTWLNGTLIPYLKIACELTTAEALFVAFAFYISYTVMALPMAAVLRRTGFKMGMALGLWIMAAGALLFIPAAETRTFGLFLTGLFVIGAGLTILQTASNPYVAIIGPIESAAKRISIMGICNKVAGVLAPLVMGALILADADELTGQLAGLDPEGRIVRLDELASRVIMPYGIMAVVLIILGMLVRWSPLPEIQEEERTSENGSSTKDSVLAYPQLVLGVIALFFYVGVEVVAGDTIGLYGQSQGIPLSEAKNFTSFTLSAMVIGYVVGILTIPRLISQARALAISAVVGVLFSAAILFTSGYVSVLFIALLGLANALMWPAIWPLAIDGLGRFTKTASALLIMAIAGGALLPLLYGRLAEVASIGHHRAYGLLVPCYLFILWYALRGHRLRAWR